MNNFDLERIAGLVFFNKAGYERVEFGSIFAGQDNVPAGQSMFDRIGGRAGFA